MVVEPRVCGEQRTVAMTCQAAVKGSMRRHCPVPALQILLSLANTGKSAWQTRRERLWIGLVAIPLAMTATGLLSLWMTWPVLLLCASAYTPSWRWLWLLTLELGFV